MSGIPALAPSPHSERWSGEIIGPEISSERVSSGRNYTNQVCRTSSNVKVRCLEVLENLGQVRRVFADKTGTLTKNQMRLRACAVNGKNSTTPRFLNNTTLMVDFVSGRSCVVSGVVYGLAPRLTDSGEKPLACPTEQP